MVPKVGVNIYVFVKWIFLNFSGLLKKNLEHIIINGIMGLLFKSPVSSRIWTKVNLAHVPI